MSDAPRKSKPRPPVELVVASIVALVGVLLVAAAGWLVDPSVGLLVSGVALLAMAWRLANAGSGK